MQLQKEVISVLPKTAKLRKNVDPKMLDEKRCEIHLGARNGLDSAEEINGKKFSSNDSGEFGVKSL